MRTRFSLALLLLLAMLAPAQQEKKEPDSVTASGNTIESPYFKFRYSFPQALTPMADDVRQAKNRKRHEEQVNRMKEQMARTVNSGKVTIRAFWNYDLLVAASHPVSDDGKTYLPYLRVWAMERSSNMVKAGAYARMLDNAPSVTLVHDTEEQIFGGREFRASGFLFGKNHYQALFETLSGDYILLFEFHGRTEQEANEL